MSFYFNITPIWDINDYKCLNYKLDKHKDNEDNKRYIEAGHISQSLTLYNYFEYNPMPKSVEYIKKHFLELKNISVAINLFKPGQYLPIHYDRFHAYKKYFNITDANICRYIVMLEDSVPGQMLEIQSQVYNKWQSGAVFGWKNQDLHSFYNLSCIDRYAVQITGQTI